MYRPRYNIKSLIKVTHNEKKKKTLQNMKDGNQIKKMLRVDFLKKLFLSRKNQLENHKKN